MIQLLKKASFLAIFISISLLWFCNPPEGMTELGWHYSIIFIVTIFAIILNVLPMGLVAFLAFTFCVVFKIAPIDKMLGAFSNVFVWLVVMAFAISKAFVKSGIGSRIAYHMVTNFGKTLFGLSYSIIATELFLAPAIPSAVARGGGIVFPIVQSLIKAMNNANGSDVETDGTGRNSRLNKFFTMLCFHTNVICSAMFVTAIASNPLVVQTAFGNGIQILWKDWFLAAIVPGMASLIFLPFILYFIFKPDIQINPSVISTCQKTLSEMGRVKKSEAVTLSALFVMIGLWICEKKLGIHATVTAMIGISILMIFEVIDWNDFISERAAFDILMWFSIIVFLAQCLVDNGVIKWFISNSFGSFIQQEKNHIVLLILYSTFFYLHYFFASVSAYVSTLYPAFLITIVNMGYDPMYVALCLGFLSVLSAGLTYYGINSAPIFFGLGYINSKEWLKVCFVISTLVLIIWMVIGHIWWLYLL